MKKMNSGKKTPPWCPFSNNRLRSVLDFLKLLGCRKKKPYLFSLVDSGSLDTGIGPTQAQEN